MGQISLKLEKLKEQKSVIYKNIGNANTSVKWDYDNRSISIYSVYITNHENHEKSNNNLPFIAYLQKKKINNVYDGDIMYINYNSLYSAPSSVIFIKCPFQDKTIEKILWDYNFINLNHIKKENITETINLNKDKPEEIFVLTRNFDNKFIIKNNNLTFENDVIKDNILFNNYTKNNISEFIKQNKYNNKYKIIYDDIDNVGFTFIFYCLPNISIRVPYSFFIDTKKYNYKKIEEILLEVFEHFKYEKHNKFKEKNQTNTIITKSYNYNMPNNNERLKEILDIFLTPQKSTKNIDNSKFTKDINSSKSTKDINNSINSVDNVNNEKNSKNYYEDKTKEIPTFIKSHKRK